MADDPTIAATVPWATPAALADLLPELRRLLASPPPGEWRRRAACLGTDPAIWFPPTGDTSRARAICAACHVRPDCAAWAAAQPDDLAGIWAGVGRRERMIRRRRTHPAA